MDLFELVDLANTKIPYSDYLKGGRYRILNGT